MDELPTMMPSGWFCPKCENVYSPKISECFNCNRKENNKNSSIHEIMRQTGDMGKPSRIYLKGEKVIIE